MSSFNSVLTDNDVRYIQTLPEVLNAKARLDAMSEGKIYFTIEITESIRLVLQTRFGLDLSSISRLPMRWIKGDTIPHIDHGKSEFENTYLVYLNDSPGEFLIGDSAYPITENTGYVFPEGVNHSTAHTGSAPRLLLGPMNEFAEPVGGSVIFYYPSEDDAVANTNLIIAYGNYTIQLVSGYTHWRIASTSTGPDPQNVVYTVGNTLNGNGTTDFYYIYPTAPCFLEGTTILCQVDGVEKYVAVENLTKGSLVKTSRDGFKKLVALGKGEIINPGNDDRIEDRLYKCSTSKYTELTSDLYITGCHSILEYPITEKQKEESIKRQGKLYVTDNKYRLMACVDERAEPWNSAGAYTIYHIALENENDSWNYGVYANGGLLVETCAIRILLSRSNMKIVS